MSENYNFVEASEKWRRYCEQSTKFPELVELEKALPCSLPLKSAEQQLEELQAEKAQMEKLMSNRLQELELKLTLTVRLVSQRDQELKASQAECQLLREQLAAQSEQANRAKETFVEEIHGVAGLVALQCSTSKKVVQKETKRKMKRKFDKQNVQLFKHLIALHGNLDSMKRIIQAIFDDRDSTFQILPSKTPLQHVILLNGMVFRMSQILKTKQRSFEIVLKRKEPRLDGFDAMFIREEVERIAKKVVENADRKMAKNRAKDREEESSE